MLTTGNFDYTLRVNVAGEPELVALIEGLRARGVAETPSRIILRETNLGRSRRYVARSPRSEAFRVPDQPDHAIFAKDDRAANPAIVLGHALRTRATRHVPTAELDHAVARA
jgi:hypothetical protein